jgi:hypothetical protein
MLAFISTLHMICSNCPAAQSQCPHTVDGLPRIKENQTVERAMVELRFVAESDRPHSMLIG